MSEKKLPEYFDQKQLQEVREKNGTRKNVVISYPQAFRLSEEEVLESLRRDSKAKKGSKEEVRVIH